MTARPLLVVLATLLLGGLGAVPTRAATLYGGGSLPPSINDPVPLFLVAVDGGRASMIGLSGGGCSNGRMGFGSFLTHRFRLHRGGRFRIKGSFASPIPGGVATGSYRIRGRVRSGRGVATGVASVRLRFPGSTAGQTISCKSGKRAFRARNPAARVRSVRGPFYGVTSQALPIVVRPAPDSSALAPVAFWTTLNCNALGPLQATARLTVPATAPGVFAKTGHVTESFRPSIGSTVSVPAGTYGYNPYGFQAQVAQGRATGVITFSSRVGNAQKQLIDTCAAPPITFSALH